MVKLEKIIFYLFIFCLPFQTRIILKYWGSPFNEWQAVFLYGTDLLLATLFVLWIFRTRHPRFDLFKDPRSNLKRVFLLIFLAIAALSITQASNKILGFYRLIKILEFVGLYYYIRHALGRVFTLNGAFLVVVVSGFFQSLVAIGQSLLQHSLELKWLGESVLRTNFSGVAVVPTAMGQFLRAYGTMPHPNVLSAWLFLAVFAFYFWYIYNTDRRTRWTVFIIYPILLWGLLVTFSRVAIGLLLAGMVLRLLIVLVKRKKYVLSQNFKKRTWLIFSTTAVTMLVLGFSYWPQVHSRIFISSQEQAVSQRILYTKMAGEIASQRPWLGVGLGQFVGALKDFSAEGGNYPDYFYQPVHNIYLLILDEIGIFGLIVFLAWLGTLVRAFYRQTEFKQLHHLSFLIVFSSILVMGLFDHFLWSLQQGQLIFWMTVGLISASGKALEVV